MARPYRLQRAECVYHITSRGDDRRAIFDTDRDFEKFLEYLLNAKRKYKIYIYAYCLMTNHYHLLIETSRPNISDVMHYLNGSYTTCINIKRKRFGHVFQGRYKSLVVDKETYFLRLSRYIHLNPVRAKMVKWPYEYRWSSYRGYLGKGDPLLDHKRIKQYLGMSRGEYRQYVNDGIDKEEDLFGKVYAGFLLGSVGFIKDRLREIKGQVLSREISNLNKIAKRADINTIAKEVGKMYGKEAEELFAARYKHDNAKKVAIYLSKVFVDTTGSEIGKRFGISPTGVAMAAKSVEWEMKTDRIIRHKVKKIIEQLCNQQELKEVNDVKFDRKSIA